jgi:hypothetical protein
MKNISRSAPWQYAPDELQLSVLLRSMMSVNQIYPHRWYLHLIVVLGFECSRDPESYAGGSIATARVTHIGQVKG